MSTNAEGDGGNNKDNLPQGQEDFETADNVFSMLFKAHERVIGGLFWILYGLRHNTSMPLPIFGLLVLLQLLQWFSFVFFVPSDIPWNSSNDEWTRWITVTASWTGNFLGKNTAGNIAAIVFSLAIPVLCGFVALTHRFFHWVWPMTTFRIYLILCFHILFFPIVGSLFRMIFGCLDLSAPHNAYYADLECGSLENGILLALSCVAVVVFVPLMLVFAACYFEINPNQRKDLNEQYSADARSSGRGDVLYTLLRIAVTVLFVIFTQFNSHRWPLSLLMVFVGGLLLRHNYHHLPYYHQVTQTIVVFRDLTILWSGLCMCVANVIVDISPSPNGNVRGAMYAFLFLCIALTVASILFVRMRSNEVSRHTYAYMHTRTQLWCCTLYTLHPFSALTMIQSECVRVSECY